MSTPTPERPYARWYGSTRWRAVSEHHRRIHPLCVRCKELGVVMEAQVTDHVVPHHGDPNLFWDPMNLQGLCKVHHDSDKQQLEQKGYTDDIGADGWPTCDQHPVYRSN